MTAHQDRADAKIRTCITCDRLVYAVEQCADCRAQQAGIS